MVAFMDAGNRRVFARFFNMPQGRMIRQEDVSETFARMANHEDYGMPQNLYIDNGSEYKMFDHMLDAFKLIGDAGFSGSLVHSTAYNPRGKAALESFFQHFEHYYLSLMPGYAGGDRQRQKTANQGRTIVVADWDWPKAEAVLYALLDRYNQTERQTLNDRAPAEVFSASATDWKPTTISVEALAFGHAKRETRTVRQRLIQLNGQQYRLSGRAGLAETVTVLVSPWVKDGLVVEYDGELIFAPPAQRRHPLDPAGAIESAALRGDHYREIEALAAGLPKLNPLAELLNDGPALVDLSPDAKGAMRHALSPKARREDEARADAKRRANDDEKAAIMARAARGPQNLPNKVA
jgi:hypothetical protein